MAASRFAASFGMDDPPPGLLEGITTIGHAMSLSGVAGDYDANDPSWPGELASTFFAATGYSWDNPIEVLVSNSKEDVHQEIGTMTILGNVFGEGVSRPLNLSEKGYLKLMDRYARLKCGLEITNGAKVENEKRQQQVETLGVEVEDLRRKLAAPPPAAAPGGSQQQQLASSSNV